MPSATYGVPRARTPDKRYGEFGGKSPNSINLRRVATPNGGNQAGW